MLLDVVGQFLGEVGVLDLHFPIVFKIEDSLYEFVTIHGLDVSGHGFCRGHTDWFRFALISA